MSVKICRKKIKFVKSLMTLFLFLNDFLFPTIRKYVPGNIFDTVIYFHYINVCCPIQSTRIFPMHRYILITFVTCMKALKLSMFT